MKTEQMIEFDYPGSFFPENSSKVCGHNDPKKVTVPKGAYAFRFFDRVSDLVIVSIAMEAKSHRFI